MARLPWLVGHTQPGWHARIVPRDTPCIPHPSTDTQVSKGSLVFDPFTGTGSILIAAAHRGAYTLGTDIDMRVLKIGAHAGTGNEGAESANWVQDEGFVCVSRTSGGPPAFPAPSLRAHTRAATRPPFLVV